jgi:hypothetical protein
MKDLDSLRSRLVSVFAPGPRAPESWTETNEMTRTVAAIRARHDSPAVEADKRTVGMAVAAFRKTGQPDGYRGLKYVCLGAGSADERGWCLFSDKPLRERLLALLDAETELRRRLKFFQSMMLAYWSFPLNSAAPAAVEGWLAVRAWMAVTRFDLQRTKGGKPEWFSVMTEHSNLLGDDPCDRYGKALLAGKTDDLRQAVEGLAIPSDSWVMDEAIVSQMKAASNLSHGDFKAVLTDLLLIATGKRGMAVSSALQTRCVAMLVSRYARCPDRPEHPALRDAAVSVIGNPWLRRASWDASVVDAGGKPDGEARDMVNGWLKERLIKDFFELLSADGTGDTRRLDYWLRFEPFIQDMWFALGSDARWRRGENFNDFRDRAKGRLIHLEGTTADNNAFVMRIGEYLAVEFGAQGNAFYLFRWDGLPKRLMDKLTSGKERVDVDISALKSDSKVARLIHKDSAGKGLTWEQKFDQSICPLIGERPAQPARRLGAATRARAAPTQTFIPAAQPSVGIMDDKDLPVLLSRVKALGIDVVDHRSQQGALWVIADDSNKMLTARLKAHGFRYKNPKGWWRE